MDLDGGSAASNKISLFLLLLLFVAFIQICYLLQFHDFLYIHILSLMKFLKYYSWFIGKESSQKDVFLPFI